MLGPRLAHGGRRLIGLRSSGPVCEAWACGLAGPGPAALSVQGSAPVHGVVAATTPARPTIASPWAACGRGFAASTTSGDGDGGDGAGPSGRGDAAPAAADATADDDWGRPLQSLEDVDDLLDAWGEMMEAGDYDGVLRMLEARTAHEEGLPPLADVLSGDAFPPDPAALRSTHERALQEEDARRRVRLVDAQGRAYATGRRKEAVARVWLRAGSGRAAVNGLPLDAALPSIARRADALAPFAVTGTLGKFDVRATVAGGGTTGQAQALRHGVAKALQLWDPAHRPALKAAGLLTRDARVVERKKPGKAKARKSFQWVKR